MRQGDIVTRKSYGGDILFRIEQVERLQAMLRGVDFRLLADSPLTDLVIAESRFSDEHPRAITPQFRESLRKLEFSKAEMRQKNQHAFELKKLAGSSYFEMPGKVLHLDGDPAYLRKCMQLYGELRVPAEGFYVPEPQMPEVIYRLLTQVKPDILVITGHDGILKHRRNGDMNQLSSYKNSLHFKNAVQVARQYDRDRDSLTIIAGACQSHFEALLQAGANFASSPARVLIHALDPLCIAAKTAYTSIKDTISMLDVMDLTATGLDGLGGVESKGCYRVGIPGIRPVELKA
ncbi:sporulation peptidase YabG [Paenibacillus eucommiae]|uniref:Spore coat assembly protein n=1 Tax=Paenibacillus eucommiae TaxID=1355755 RepID=A0ABS4J8M3_9BACL|nr:sporulation peptidase YabG [Paenibacillus eucommiae]MBP1996185.1 spore coat assembly protein [Paenibacillus eucommiae]